MGYPHFSFFFSTLPFIVFPSPNRGYPYTFCSYTLWVSLCSLFIFLPLPFFCNFIFIVYFNYVPSPLSSRVFNINIAFIFFNKTFAHRSLRVVTKLRNMSVNYDRAATVEGFAYTTHSITGGLMVESMWGWSFLSDC